jgi:hypothetical protein
MADVLPTFEWYDAWILAAVVWASDSEGVVVPLWRLIATADALNKAIVTRGELEVGIGRLARAGYLRAAPDGFEATPAALALKAPGPPMEIIARAIGAREWSPQTEMPRTADAAYVTAEAYDKALKKYRKEFWKEYR